MKGEILTFSKENKYMKSEKGVTLTALAIAAILGIVLNAILPGRDYEFEMARKNKDNIFKSGNMNKTKTKDETDKRNIA